MTFERNCQTWSTATATGCKLSYWNEVVCETVIELEIETETKRQFNAHMVQSDCGPISFSKMQIGGSQTLSRSRSRIAKSNRDQFELVYFTECTGTLIHAGNEVDVRSNQCVLIDGNRPYTLDMNGPSHNVSIHIPSKWLATRLPDLEQAVANPIDCITPYGSALANLIGAMIQEKESSDEFDSHLAEQIIGIFNLSLESKNVGGSPAPNKLFKRARQMLANLSNDPLLSAPLLAEELGISVRYLHSVLAKAGTTYGRELQDIRLKMAATMLQDSRFREISISEIAYRVGYKEPSHFSRRFKEATGNTPASYRNAKV